MSHFRVSAEDITRTPEEEGEKTVPVPEAWGKLNPFYSTEPTDCEIEEYAFGVNKGNTALLDAINAALKELKDDGTIEAIILKYNE